MAQGYIPPDAKPWVDHIRSKGNEATHEIPQVTESDARNLILVTEMLMKHVYEVPALINPVAPSTPPTI